MAVQLMCASGRVSVAHRLKLLQGRGFGWQVRRRRRAANGRREVRPARPCHMNVARTHVHLSLPWQVCTRLLMQGCSSDGRFSSDNCSSGAAATLTMAAHATRLLVRCGCLCHMWQLHVVAAMATRAMAARAMAARATAARPTCDNGPADGCTSDAARGFICVCAKVCDY